MPSYDYFEQIGQGGGGIVRAAVRDDDGWPCAAKFLNTNYTPEDLTRFKRACRMLTALVDGQTLTAEQAVEFMVSHHVVPVVATQFSEKPPWYIMPRCSTNLKSQLDGCNLKDIPSERLLSYFCEAAKGVEFAHSKKVIHRDIKPANILLFRHADRTHAAVSDFEIGRFLERDTPPVTDSREALGTFLYMAPEQMIARKADERSDIFSLGLVLYEVLTLYPPSSLEIDRVPQQYRRIILRATNPQHTMRYSSVTDLLAELRSVMEKQGLGIDSAE
jgi:eukaryotic-like serine/threonine-protein kinase